MLQTNWIRLRKWALVVVLAGFVGLLTVAWFTGSALVAPANGSVGLPPADFPATSVQIESASGATLAGWHLELPDSSATAILIHPIRADRRSMLSRARLFRDHGYSTLLIDLQAHGESAGEHITLGYVERHDVLASIEYVRSNNPDHKIVVVGRSLGGASTLLANPVVDAVVLESVYSNLSQAVHNRIQMRLGMLHHVLAPLLLVQLKPRLGISPSQLCPIDQLGRLKCPVIFAVGDRDDHTTMDETKRMFDRANDPKRLVVFEGAGHCDLHAYDPLKYENTVVGYLNKVIGE